MNKLKYTKKPGDFEIRILADGMLVMVGPDEEMLEITKTFRTAENLENNNSGINNGKIKPKTSSSED